MTHPQSPQTVNGSTPYDSLVNLALNLGTLGSGSTVELWKSLDEDLWASTQNPWLMLQTVSQEKIDFLLAKKEIQDLLRQAEAQEGKEAAKERWFARNHGNAPLKTVAYFSMEFMLSETLPIYSGGLGNVAGDQLKAADDLGVPVVGVSLLYAQGYFRQSIDENGNQLSLYPYNDPGQLPVKPLRLPNGEWLRIQIDLPGSTLWLRTWEARIGHTKLYLLDTNDPVNVASDRCITSELYGGGQELRLKQEIVLGIAGWRLLRALGFSPEVCHLNEGHAAFAVLERARCYMEDHDVEFATALTVTRAGNIFTTHTAVEAGFDRFSPSLIRTYLTKYAEKLNISLDTLLAYGRQSSSDAKEPFNMALLAIRGSTAVNGVSELHGRVSRAIFKPLFPRRPESEVPVGYITNGVHMPTWLSKEAADLWVETCGAECWSGNGHNSAENIRKLSDDQIWGLRTTARQQLIEHTRSRYARQVAECDGDPESIEAARGIFDPNILTLGFARRFATYKRSNLLLTDPDRLQRILCNHDRPVQLIIAGKAHPQDMPGQALIKQWFEFIKRPDIQGRVVFLSDYDMLMTQQFAPGIDVWLNTPRRPWEASGTSGMKVLANGGLNVSELDGWWAEAYTPEVGWAIGDRLEHGDDPLWDRAEAEALYTLLEQEVVPDFYDRNISGMPVRWVERIRESMAKLAPAYSASRTVSQYTEQLYLPAAAGYQQRSKNHGRFATEILMWQVQVARLWDRVRFGALTVDHAGGRMKFSLHVYLAELAPEEVSVELFADADNCEGHITIEMTNAQPLIASAGGYLYTAELPDDRPETDYTPRIVPYMNGVHVPLENAHILWMR
jgi:starch phosphorylase